MLCCRKMANCNHSYYGAKMTFFLFMLLHTFNFILNAGHKQLKDGFHAWRGGGGSFTTKPVRLLGNTRSTKSKAPNTGIQFPHDIFANRLLPKLQARTDPRKILLHAKHPSKSCLDLTSFRKHSLVK